MLWPLRSKKPAGSPIGSPVEAQQPASPPSLAGDRSDALSASEEPNRGAAPLDGASKPRFVPAVEKEGTMNFQLYTDITRSAEELAGALENLANAADNFAYTYGTLSNVKRTGGDLQFDDEGNLAVMIDFARTLSEANHNLASTLQRSFAAPLKKDYNACSTIAKSTIQGNDKKMASVVKEMRLLEAKSFRERRKKDRTKYENSVWQLRMMGAEVQELHIEKETKADELARASLPLILNNSQAGVVAVAEHYVPFANAILKLLTRGR
ncbi:MAG: hypothetical protein BJ554DRAFT_1643 [Olpidium bornovanus]|uniref:BAR domain-containing protein n=1 Tax=Olpidium bornovanus TaxID=278681 RepID=A0A8H8DGX7_9FUNG|nr:MAG: hypothetical protein BJ554DRAFT_1643 [Olpidium bornovanus]